MRTAGFLCIVGLVVLTMCVGAIPTLCAQQAPVDGMYEVPRDWTVQSSEDRVTLTDSAKRAVVYLMVYRDTREPLQVCGDYVSRQMKDKSSKYDVLSKKIFSYSRTEVARIEVEIKASGRRAQKEWVVGVPANVGTLLLVAKMPSAYAKEFEPVVDKIAKSALPSVETKWLRVTNDVLGLRLMVAPLWKVKPDPKEGHTNSPEVEIFKGSAHLSLYSSDGKRTAKEYLDELEKSIKAKTKTYTRAPEERLSIAGVWGTRLNVTATGADGVTVRESLVVFAREDRWYVVKTSAPDSQSEQYNNDFMAMINSVAPLPPKMK